MNLYLKRFFAAFILLFGLNGIASAIDCTPKTDYDSLVTCSEDVFVARTESDLDSYLTNFGLENGQYKNLRITFNPDRTNLAIHSPCSIYFVDETSLVGSSICLDARGDIEIGNYFTASSSRNIKVISQNENIFLNRNLLLVGKRIEFLAHKRFRIASESNVEVEGDFSASSTGQTDGSLIYFAEDAALSANNISLSAVREMEIFKDASLTATGDISLSSTGSSAWGSIKLRSGAEISAQGDVTLSSQNRLRIVAGASITARNKAQVTARGCRIAEGAIIDAPSLEGNCLEDGHNLTPPIIHLQATPLIGPTPLTVSFSAEGSQDRDGSITNYFWDFGNGQSSTGLNSSHTYTNAGEYKASLVITDDDGVKVPTQVTVQAGGNLPPTADAGEDQSATVGQTLRLDGSDSTDDASGSLGYSWEMASRPSDSMALLGKTDTANPFFVPDKPGQYTVALTVSDGAHSSSDTVAITVSEAVNVAPTLNSIGNKSVILGSELKFQVSGSDGDSDPIIFGIESGNLPKNASFDGGTGEFTFRPEQTQVGQHTVIFFAFDELEMVREEITITVTAPAMQPTRLRGKIFDANSMADNGTEVAVIGATVSILSDNTVIATSTTTSTGEFTLDNITEADSYVFKIQTSTAQNGPSGAKYADFSGPLSFDLIENVDNIASRPFYISRIDASSSTPVVAGLPTNLSNSTLGIELSAPADTVTNSDGTPFTGNITISNVPKEFVPVPLPENFDPTGLITIQPLEIQFSTLPSLSFPNDLDIPAGSVVNIYSIDPDTGNTTVVGTGTVSADGEKIETTPESDVQGTAERESRRLATVFYSAPPPDVSLEDIRNQDYEDRACGRFGDAFSRGYRGCPDIGAARSPLSKGFLLVNHDAAAYQSLGTARGVRLSYNSKSADPRPFVYAQARIPPNAGTPRGISSFMIIDRTFWGIGSTTPIEEADYLPGNILRQKIQFTARGYRTGIYSLTMMIQSRYAISRRSRSRDDLVVSGTAEGRMVVINQRESALGAGWSLFGHQEVYEDENGDVLLHFGNSNAKIFTKEGDGSFSSPRGDYSTLTKDGENYIRALKNGTSYIFNSQGLLTKIVERDNNTTLYCYEEGTRKIKYIEDPMGKRIHFAYDGEKVSEIRDPANRITRLIYEGDNLRRIINPDGSARRFFYDRFSRMLAQSTESNRAYNYSYDDYGRVSASSSENGAAILVTSIPSLGLRAPDSNMVSGSQGESGRLERLVDIITIDGERATLFDRNGNMNEVRTNEFGSTVEHNTEDNRTRIRRDYNNNITSITDPLGRRTTNEYDAMGNLTLTRDEETGATTRYTYELNFNQVTSITDPMGRVTRLEYDSLGNLIKNTNAKGEITKYTYNVAGQVKTITDPLGNMKRYHYDDSNGNLMAYTDSLGNTTHLTYDDAGNNLSITDPEGNISSFEYDVMNRGTKRIDSKGNEVLLTYDGEGNLRTTVDENENRTVFFYDRENRLIRRIDPSGREDRYSYDNEGNIVERVDRNGNKIIYKYNALNRLIEKDLAGEGIVQYAYDAVGNLTRVGDDDSVLDYSYNSRNQIVTALASNVGLGPSSISYTYDLAGNRTQIAFLGDTINYSYDSLNRPVTLSHRANSFGFEYDGNSNLIRQNNPNGSYSQYIYDGESQLLDLSHKHGETLLVNLGYAYNRNGMHTEVRVNRPIPDIAPRINYEYDSLNQLVKGTNPLLNGEVETFSYDGAGNRLRKTGESEDPVFDSNNRPTEDANYNYTYDFNGNLTRKEHKISRVITVYIWDRENRLTNVKEYRNRTAQASKIINYRYDPFGRRIEKRVREENKVPVARHFIYTGAEILLEYKGANQLRAKYLYSAGANRPLAMITDGRTYYYHQDSLNSVMMLTDEGGAPVRHYVYDSYGNVSAYNEQLLPIELADTNNDPIENPFTYTGQEYDQETGNYYYGARYYSPATGRFISEEPGGQDRPNLYWYARNNPVFYIDPDGRISIIAAYKGVEKIVEGVGDYIRGEGSERDLVANLVEGGLFLATAISINPYETFVLGFLRNAVGREIRGQEFDFIASAEVGAKDVGGSLLGGFLPGWLAKKAEIDFSFLDGDRFLEIIAR